MDRFKLIPAVATAAIVLLGACGGDDDSAQPPGPGSGDAELEQTGEGVLGGGAAEDASAGGESGDFCDWFTSAGPVPSEWDMGEAGAQTVPPEIAEAFEAIVAGDASLSNQTEVTNWVTENCF